MAHYDSFGVAPVRTSCCFHSLCAFTCCDIQCVFCFSGCRTARTRTAAASPYCWSSRDCFPDSTPTSALMQGNIDELNRLLKLISVCVLHKNNVFCRYNLLFFLSGGGKFNYQGTKRWLEDNLDHTGTNIASLYKLDSTFQVFHSHLRLKIGFYEGAERI